MFLSERDEMVGEVVNYSGIRKAISFKYSIT